MIVTLKPGPTRLLCFPPAGAGARYFRELAAHVDGGVVAVDYPGHESLYREPFATDRAGLVERLAEAVDKHPDLDPANLVYLGHSLGATLAFELALQIPPRLTVLSARNWVPAGSAQPAPDDETATDGELTDWLRALGGTPEEVLNHEGLMATFLPIIRADLALGAQPSPAGSVDGALATVCGTTDPAASPAGMAKWRHRCRDHLGDLALPGDHHALIAHADTVIAQISDWSARITLPHPPQQHQGE